MVCDLPSSHARWGRSLQVADKIFIHCWCRYLNYNFENIPMRKIITDTAGDGILTGVLLLSFSFLARYGCA
jgi:hypothetical protein